MPMGSSGIVDPVSSLFSLYQAHRVDIPLFSGEKVISTTVMTDIGAMPFDPAAYNDPTGRKKKVTLEILAETTAFAGTFKLYNLSDGAYITDAQKTISALSTTLYTVDDLLPFISTSQKNYVARAALNVGAAGTDALTIRMVRFSVRWT